MEAGQILVTVGFLCMGLALLGGLAFFIVLRVSGKRLRRRLDREYGEKYAVRQR